MKLRFLFSAHRLMLLYIYIIFREISRNGADTILDGQSDGRSDRHLRENLCMPRWVIYNKLNKPSLLMANIQYIRITRL